MDTHFPGIREGQSLTSKWAGFFLALLGIVAATIAGLLIAERWGTAPAVLLYLLPVLGAAIYGGVWLSLAAALIATLAYNYFFTAPFQTLMISRPSDIVTVFVLFIVALVTSSLAGSLRVKGDKPVVAHVAVARINDSTMIGAVAVLDGGLPAWLAVACDVGQGDVDDGGVQHDHQHAQAQHHQCPPALLALYAMRHGCLAPSACGGFGCQWGCQWLSRPPLIIHRVS